MRDLIALRPLTYASRRLQVGDYFTARTRSDARVLVALGKAKRGPSERVPGKVPPPPPTVIQKVAPAALEQDASAGDRDALRAEYRRIVGKKPFHGWNEDELRKRINEAQG